MSRFITRLLLCWLLLANSVCCYGDDAVADTGTPGDGLKAYAEVIEELSPKRVYPLHKYLADLQQGLLQELDQSEAMNTPLRSYLQHHYLRRSRKPLRGYQNPSDPTPSNPLAMESVHAHNLRALADSVECAKRMLFGSENWLAAPAITHYSQIRTQHSSRLLRNCPGCWPWRKIFYNQDTS